MVIYLGTDHAGYKLKEYLKKYLQNKKLDFVDLGTYSEKEKDDYPDFAHKVCKKLIRDKKSKGVLICGTGTGMVIAANRYKGIRATLAYDKYSAEMSRKDNDSNVLCLRGRKVKFEEQERLLHEWLNTDFSNNLRHKRRIKKIEKK